MAFQNTVNLLVRTLIIPISICFLSVPKSFAAEMIATLNNKKCRLDYYPSFNILQGNNTCFDVINIYTQEEINNINQSLIGLINQKYDVFSKINTQTAISISQNYAASQNAIKTELSNIELRLTSKITQTINETMSSESGANGVQTETNRKLEELVRKIVQQELAKSKE